MNWYYVDGPHRLGPIGESDWAELVRSGKIQPETLVWYTGLPNWIPFQQVPPPPVPEVEETEPDIPEESPVEPIPESDERFAVLAAEAFSAHVMEREYSAFLGDSLRRARDLFQAHFWMLAGATLLTYALVMLGNSLPVLSLLMPIALNGVLMGGLYYVYLQSMRGEPVEVTDLFIGFQRGLFRNLLMKTLVASLVSFACLIPAAIAMAVTGLEVVNNPAQADPLAMMVVLVVFLACTIPLVYFSFCWIFALPLIADKRLPFGPAMRLSRKKVLQHPWRVSWVITVAGFLVVVPSILLFAGLLIGGGGDLTTERLGHFFEISITPLAFTAPLYIGTVLSLYEEIFGERPAKKSPVLEEEEAPKV